MGIKNKVFQTWLISYVFILVIPIIIGSFVYVKSIKIINEEVSKAHYLSLNQLKNVIDGNFEELSRLSIIIGQNQDLKILMYSGNLSSSKNIYTLTRIQQDLAKLKVSNSFVDEIYIYLNDNDYAFTSTYKYDDEEIKDLCMEKLLLSYEELTEIARTKQFNSCILRRKDIGNGKLKRVLVFVQSLYFNDYKLPVGAVFITVDGDKLMQLLKNLKWVTNSNVLLVNEINEFIDTDNLTEIPDYVRFEVLKKSRSTFHGNFLNNEVAITHVSSGVVNLEYVSVMPIAVFLHKVQYIKRIIYVYVFICLLFGTFIAYNLTRMNYRPVRNLIQMYIDFLGKDAGSSKNEFKFMEDSLRRLLEENRSFMSRLKQQRESMRNYFFVKLFKGNIKSLNSVKDSADLYDIKFSGDNFLVVAFNIEQLSDDYKGESTEEEVNLIYFIIKNIFEELINEKYVSYAVEINGRIACLINFNVNEENKDDVDIVLKDIIQIVDKGNNFIENKFNIVLCVAVSNIHYGLHGISKAYSEVLEVLEYKSLVGDKNRIICYNDISSEAGIYENTSNFEKIRQFINCIEVKDYKNAARVLDNIIENDIKSSKSLQMIKCSMSGLTFFMLNAIGEMMTDADMEFLEKLNSANRLLNAKTVTELLSQVKYIFDSVVDYSTNKDKNDMPRWIRDVEDFIKMHYHDPNLSIASIAEKFNLSVSYLSRTYKKYKGIGLLDYIQRIRLNKAKEMLNDKQMSLTAIAKKVGLLDDKALRRLFLKYEGTTPGRIRDND